MKRIASLVSGGGTTNDAILGAIQGGTLTGIEPGLLVASKHGIGAIDKALARGMPKSDIVW